MIITEQFLKKKKNDELIQLLNKSADICEGFRLKLIGYLNKIQEYDIEYEQIMESLQTEQIDETKNVKLILLTKKIEECNTLISQYKIKMEKEENIYGMIIYTLNNRYNGVI